MIADVALILAELCSRIWRKLTGQPCCEFCDMIKQADG